MNTNLFSKYDAIDEDFEKSLLDFLKNEYA